MFSSFQKACNLPSGFHTKSLHILFSYNPAYLAALLMLCASLSLSLSFSPFLMQTTCVFIGHSEPCGHYSKLITLIKIKNLSISYHIFCVFYSIFIRGSKYF